MAPMIWLVTGCSSGFGEEFILDILARGDKAIATTRGPVSRISKLSDAGAMTYSLDVTASQAEINSIVATMLQESGGIDVLVNNAGYVEAVIMEEASYESYLAQFEVNVFGAIRATQAVLPHFRQKRSGTVAWIGSMMGFVSAPGAAPYTASKFALEGIHECLLQSVAQFNIKSILFEPGFFRTLALNPQNLKAHRPNAIPDYDEFSKGMAQFLEAIHGNEPGDPKKAIQVMLDVVKAEGVAAGKATPERLPLGADALDPMRKKCLDTLALFNEWEEVIRSTDVDK